MPPNEADMAGGTPDAGAGGDGGAAVTETTPLAVAEGVDPVKVKFVAGTDTKVDMSGGGGDPEVAIKAGASDSEFRALTKAELMKYAKDPFWVGVRWTLFVLFWVAWVAMLVGAIVIIVLAPKCPTPEPKQWWQKAPIYQVYVQSFKDSNGDGLGDLKGVESKLDYLKDIGVGSVALSPFFPSPMKDGGYDITDYQDVDSKFGSLEDFKSLLAASHEKDLKVVIDFVPNHSSKEHPWFQKSANRESGFEDFYVWRDADPTGGPPNNWKSVFGGSAWEKDDTRGQYYLHNFMAEQPDLNLRNAEVVKKLKEALKFWLDLGVDGFRVDGVAFFFEDKLYGDEAETGDSGDGYLSVEHLKTYEQEENLKLLEEFRKVLDAATEEDASRPRVMMTEAYVPVADYGKYYGEVVDQIGSVSQMPMNFGLIEMAQPVAAEKFMTKIKEYTNGLPDVTIDPEANLKESDSNALSKAWSNFVTGNHDNSRMVERFGDDLLDGVNMLVMLMQGTPMTYYGDEIGMVDGTQQFDSDPEKRQNYRTPMQWTSEQDAGINVEDQLGRENSHLAVFKYLAKMRHQEAILFGETEFIEQGQVVGFTRIKKGSPGLVVLVNFGDTEAVDINVSGLKNVGGEEAKGNTVLRSSQYQDETPEQTVMMNKISLKPKEGKVINFVPKFG